VDYLARDLYTFVSSSPCRSLQEGMTPCMVAPTWTSGECRLFESSINNEEYSNSCFTIHIYFLEQFNLKAKSPLSDLN
jgi:hypothetical protein